MGFGDIIGVIGLGVSVVGFGLTVWQLFRTARAAIETRDAIVRANRRMLLNHLLVLLPQLRSLESDLDNAIAGNDSVAAIRALNGFSYAANQIAALLTVEDSLDVELIEDLRKSAKSASANKSILVGGAPQSLSVVLRTISEQVSDISARCAGLTTAYQMKVS